MNYNMQSIKRQALAALGLRSGSKGLGAKGRDMSEADPQG
jgi:hypothetical protein